MARYEYVYDMYIYIYIYMCVHIESDKPYCEHYTLTNGVTEASSQKMGVIPLCLILISFCIDRWPTKYGGYEHNSGHAIG